MDIKLKSGETLNINGEVIASTFGKTNGTSSQFLKADGSVDSNSYATTSQLSGKQDTITDLGAIRAGATAGATAYQKPDTGIPARDIAVGVIPDVSSFITKDVNDLTNYYTKTTVDAKIQEAEDNIPFAEGSGTDSAEHWNCSAQGDYSVATGYNTAAKGSASHTEGNNTTANGDNAHAEGYRTTTNGANAHIEGRSQNKPSDATIAKANDALIADWNTSRFSLAKGNAAHVEGYNNLALANYTHAEGAATIALTQYSHAEGFLTVASGDTSHAEGRETEANGNYSHAEGYKAIARGAYSHAEGGGGTGGDVQYTQADGAHSHAEGCGTIASGHSSHAEGRLSNALGDSSHAEGYGTTASGQYSHAEGYETTVLNNSEHAEGIFNVSNSATTTYGNSGNTQHSVGIGTSDSDRKNAFEIMQNGDAYLFGVGGYDGTNPASASTIQEVIGDIETLLSQI